ncbi:MAG: hypothetical protein A2Y77_09970 [Planctomycetes bacterium RBG_13_62_9]|nr:MAG: hypothetical protein A2Y77_09970 [Planctomycetes bacterium RBG_13_62_9]
MKPIRNLVLVEPAKAEEKTSGGIIIPDTAKDRGPVRKGTVLDMGPDVGRISPSRITGFGVGSIIRYHARYEIPDDKGQMVHLIEDGDILGVEKEIAPDGLMQTLFPLPSWDEFCSEGHDLWKEYANIRAFTFRVEFLRHTLPKEVLIRTIYEHCCRLLRGKRSIDGHEIRLNVPEGNQAPEVKVQDDFFDCEFTLTEGHLTFDKTLTNLENLVETLPDLTAVFASVIRSPEFQQVLGTDCNRVAFTNIIIQQHIRLTGRGKTRKQKVQNWELMAKLLRIDLKETEPAKTLFGCLGPERGSLGRSDVTIGFNKEIANHMYHVFMEVQAPTNDESTLMTVEWQIQDHRPGVLGDRDYAPVITTFLRDTVLMSFYQEWFSDVYCSTLGNK